MNLTYPKIRLCRS